MTVSRVLLPAAVLLAAAQTVGPCLYSPLGIDEQVSYYVSAGSVPETVFARAVGQSATPPLYFGLARRVLGSDDAHHRDRFNEWRLRLPAWLALMASILVAYGMGERWIGAGSGGVAALLLACHPEAIHVATQARPYALGILANLVATDCLFRLRSTGWSRWSIAGFLVANGGLLWTHYLFAVLLPTQLLLASFSNLRDDDERVEAGRRPIALFALLGLWIIPILAALPLLPGIIRLIENGPFLNWITDERPWHRQLDLVHGVPFVWAFGLGLLLFGVRWMRGRRIAKASPEASPAAPDRGEESSSSRLIETPSIAAGLKVLVALLIWFAVPIYSLWFASRFLGPSLAQPRYYLIQVAPMALLLAFGMRWLAGAKFAWLLALVFVFVDGTPGRVIDILRRPDRHDHYWLDAARLLDEQASAGDLTLVRSGLVETSLLPAHYEDRGFQEYTTSRLSDFYLRTGLVRLSLPLIWNEGRWQAEYADRIEATCRRGGTVWMVVSADSDLGESVESATIHWLQGLRLRAERVDDERVARVYRFHCP